MLSAGETRGTHSTRDHGYHRSEVTALTSALSESQARASMVGWLITKSVMRCRTATALAISAAENPSERRSLPTSYAMLSPTLRAEPERTVTNATRPPDRAAASGAM